MREEKKHTKQIRDTMARELSVTDSTNADEKESLFPVFITLLLSDLSSLLPEIKNSRKEAHKKLR